VKVFRIVLLALFGIGLLECGAVRAKPAIAAESRKAMAAFEGGFVFSADRESPGGGFTANLYLVRSGKAPQQLTHKLWVGGHVRVSPNGRLVAFVEYTGRPVDAEYAGIVIFDLKTGKARRLPRTAGMAHPAWSPRGDRLLVSTADGLLVMKADGSGRRLLTRGDDGHPAWAPHGRRIAFIRHTPKHRYRSAIFIASADGRNARRLSPFTASDHEYMELLWRPHAGRLAYLLEDLSLSLITLSGRRTTITPDSYFEITWFGEDGIAFRSEEGDGVEAIRLDGSERQTLFNLKGLRVTGLDWSNRL
jgi:dipeptidyl aminopeptidase/acylaminoacyl peptidase